MVKKNDLIQLKINGITNLGFGVGRHEGMVNFCSDTVPGDEAVCRIIKLTPSYAIARCEQLITPSPDRCYDRCGIATCKSCTYKLLSYERELKYKKELIIQDRYTQLPLTADTLLQINANPDNFYMAYLEWDPEKEALVQQLESLFSSHIIAAEKNANSYDYCYGLGKQP